jgi:hypothetical protein
MLACSHKSCAYPFVKPDHDSLIKLYAFFQPSFGDCLIGMVDIRACDKEDKTQMGDNDLLDLVVLTNKLSLFYF